MVLKIILKKIKNTIFALVLPNVTLLKKAIKTFFTF